MELGRVQEGQDPADQQRIQAGRPPFPGWGRKRMDLSLGRPHSRSAPGGQRSSLALTSEEGLRGSILGAGLPALLPLSLTHCLCSLPPQPGACGLGGAVPEANAHRGREPRRVPPLGPGLMQYLPPSGSTLPSPRPLDGEPDVH